MVEPKMQEKPATAVKNEKEAETAKPTDNRYWNYVQTTRMIEAPKVAVFSGDGGLILVPLDRIGRPVLDSSLFLPVETLEILAEAMAKLEEEDKD